MTQGPLAPTPKNNKYISNAESIREKLRHIGQAAASWHDLGQHSPKTADLPPHLKPEAIGALDWNLLEKLDKTAQQEHDRSEVMLWVTDSEYYQKIRQYMMNDSKPPMRSIVGKMHEDDALLYAAAKKFCKAQQHSETPRAMCNAFWRPEWEKHRRRSLVEPIINDIIDAINSEDKRAARPPSLPYGVRYTEKAVIRNSVLVHSHAALADMSSWFDQLSIAHSLQPLFSVATEEGNIYELCVAAMGYKPACRVAHKTLSIIAPQESPKALFVDNAAFYGTEQEANMHMSNFLRRAAAVGAVVNNENNAAQTAYEFLGEAYCHKTKTRCLTQKTRDKCLYIAEALDELQKKGRRVMRCQRVLAIIGTLTYAAEILDIPMSSMTSMLTLLSSASIDAANRGTWDHNVTINATAAQQMRQLAADAGENVPVHVTHGHKALSALHPTEISIFIDASIWGWGAVVISSSGTRFISQQWSDKDHEEAAAMGGHLGSSAVAEPMAARRVLCDIPLKHLNQNYGGLEEGQRALNNCYATTKITLHTDHHALVDLAGVRRISNSMSYNKFICLINDLGRKCQIDVVFVAGEKNPADPLSRGRPPVLEVTHIGGPPMYG